MDQTEKDLLNEVFSIIAEQMEMLFEEVDALRMDVLELQERVGMLGVLVDTEDRPEL